MRGATSLTGYQQALESFRTRFWSTVLCHLHQWPSSCLTPHQTHDSCRWNEPLPLDSTSIQKMKFHILNLLNHLDVMAPYSPLLDLLWIPNPHSLLFVGLMLLAWTIDYCRNDRRAHCYLWFYEKRDSIIISSLNTMIVALELVYPNLNSQCNNPFTKVLTLLPM